MCYFVGAENIRDAELDSATTYAEKLLRRQPSNPLKPGGTCQIRCISIPSIVGTENATYKVFDNSPGSPQTLSLTGKGK